jgi:hypothetical protein
LFAVTFSMSYVIASRRGASSKPDGAGHLNIADWRIVLRYEPGNDGG